MPIILFILALLFIGFTMPVAAISDGNRSTIEDGDTSISQLRARAEKGEADAQRLLGESFFKGRTMVRNFSLAQYWIERAAVQGDPVAQYQTGYFYENGLGVPFHLEKAVEWYEFAAKQDHLPAQVRLGEILDPSSPKAMKALEQASRRGSQRAVRVLRHAAANGFAPARGILRRIPHTILVGGAVPPPAAGNAADAALSAFLGGDYETAMAAFKPLADKGNPGALFGLGLFRHFDGAFAEDAQKAARLYQTAAKKGHAGAQFNLARLYALGRGVDQDWTAAKQWLQAAAGAGHPAAKELLSTAGTKEEYALAHRLAELPVSIDAGSEPSASVKSRSREEAAGIAAFVKGDYETAMASFKPLALTGDAGGWFGLAIFYDTGKGFPRDLAKAREFYRQAAEMGYAGAQANLGSLYLSGGDTNSEPVRALEWYRRAAGQGDTLAQNVVGLMYLLGRGVVRDEKEALKWLRMAADKGNQEAVNVLGVMRLRRSPDSATDAGSELKTLAVGVSATGGYAGLGDNLAETIAIECPASGGPTKGTVEAIALFKKAAKKGDAIAQVNLGKFFQGDCGVPRDLVRAYKWLKLASHYNHQGTSRELGSLVARMSLAQTVEAEWQVAEALKPVVVRPPEFVSAEEGSPDAQWALGRKFEKGIEVEKSHAEAVKWYLRAAKQGYAEAQRRLGYMYENARGVGLNRGEAARWYRKAAEQGMAKAERDLGIIYQFGKGVPQDDQEAVKWYHRAAEKGDAKAQANLGFMYKVGRGTKQDLAQAVAWYRKAAEQGSSRAQKSLGLLYQQGKGVPQDDGKALEWYRKAAIGGSRSGAANLGFLYKTGRGMLFRDYAEAAKWYSKAAEGGLARAQNVLGLMAWEGKGLDQNDTTAVQWFTEAIKQGHEEAQKNLDAFVKGGHGKSDDFMDVARHLQSKANGGSSWAQNSLGLLYQYGMGVAKDRRQAEKLFRAALKRKNAKAQENLNALLAKK